MMTRRWLSFLLLLCALTSASWAAQTLRIVAEAGTTYVEYSGREFVVETTAAIYVEFSTTADGVTARVQLVDASANSATVLISAADDPQEVIFEGVVRDADDFRDLFFRDETGRGEQ